MPAWWIQRITIWSCRACVTHCKKQGGGDNYQLKPDFTGRSITRIQAPRDFTRDPETLPAAVAASISSINLEKQQLAHVCVSACMCLHEPAVQTYTINSTGKKEIVVWRSKKLFVKICVQVRMKKKGKNYFHLSVRQRGQGIKHTHPPSNAQEELCCLW